MRVTPNWRRRAGAIAGAILASLFAVAPAPAQDLDPQKVGAWADAFFHRTMVRSHVPGAVVVVVDHGRVVLLRGYGVTTPVGGHPIDPQRTLFRLGSITKVLTAIAATQMIDEGRIDPGADVNRYLRRIRIPGTYAPITVADLLAHEGGFGADLRGVDAPTNVGAASSPVEMQRLLVPRVRPPGEYIAYDNNGWGVLGLALADASGTSYRDLIASRIFRPLGMSHAVIGLPDPVLKSAIEEHYVFPDGRVQRIPHSLLKPMEQGAGDASATGADMARLMTALLQGGVIDGHRILDAAEFRALTDMDEHRLHPMLPGLARALYEDRPNGRVAIRHDGGMAGSAASMELYPDLQIGVFFAINARPYTPFDGETLSGVVKGIKMFLIDPPAKISLGEFLPFLSIHEKFAKAFLPPAPPEKVRIEGVRKLSDAQIRDLAGVYVATHSQFASFAGNLQVRLLEGLAVSPGPAGTVMIGGKPYRQIYPDLFENRQSGQRYAFTTNAYGTFMGPAALWIMRRIAWYDTPVLTVLPLLVLPLFLMFGIFYRRSSRPLYRELGTTAAALSVLYLVCLALEGEFANAVLIADRMWLAHLWRAALQIAILGFLLWPIRLALGWASEGPAAGAKGVAAAIHYSIMAVAGWALVWLAFDWNLLGKL